MIVSKLESKYAITTQLDTKGVASLKTNFPKKNKTKNITNGTDNQTNKSLKSNSKQLATVQIQPKNQLQTNALPRQSNNLPIHNCQNHLMQELRKLDTLLIMGETGSGKTTQIPQMLLACGYGNKGIIGVTQPRRVAVITIAKRVASERECRLGELVGYTVRFEDCTSPQTRIRFLTDGSLLREALVDRLLRNYSVIMLDEAHERTINTDVLFGIVKEAQRQRNLQKIEPLKIIVTSATMDIDHLGKYFGVCGMYLEGRTHPVRVLHTKESQPDYVHSILVTLFDIIQNTPNNHDVLIFLTGQEEIDSVAQQIRQIVKVQGMTKIRVYPLYAQLPQNKQLECFLPALPNTRKIILATNIAETSITIPGIRCVIDSGFVKMRTFNANSGLDVLKVVRISQAQAWQRCGRAGRDSSGMCYRTYTQTEMNEFEHLPKPEILRSNLNAIVLQLLVLGIDCRKFNFLDKPPPDILEKAFKSLILLEAINASDSSELTAKGRKMAMFPLEPKYSKLLMHASSFGCMEEMLSIVAILSSENFLISSTERREAATLAHAKYQSKHGDMLTLLNIFQAFEKVDKVKQWCHENFLNLRNLQYAKDVRKQLSEIVCRLKLEMNSCGENYDQVRKCLLMGLFENVAELQRDQSYITLMGRQRAKIHPSSVFHGKYRPQTIIFTEIVLTEQKFLRQITEINSEWLSEVVPNFKSLIRKYNRDK